MDSRSGFELIPGPAKVVAAVIGAACAALAVVVVATNNISFPGGIGLLLAGSVGGSIIAGVILLAGFVYGDAGRRGMPKVPWLLLVLLVPNGIGFVLYFLLRKPLLEPCAKCGAIMDAAAAFCSRCGAPQGLGARA